MTSAILSIRITPCLLLTFSFFFFFNDTATTEIYTLSLHDALPIWQKHRPKHAAGLRNHVGQFLIGLGARADRKSTRLNSSHSQISYAVFCLKKKKTNSTIEIFALQRRKAVAIILVVSATDRAALRT